MPREITYNWLDRPAELTAQEALFVSRLKANEDAAYDELVRTYSGPIYHVAYRMTGDAAEASDAVQDIFLKIFRNIEGFSYTEIADVLGISMGTVKSRLARARADLKKSLMRYLSVRYL